MKASLKRRLSRTIQEERAKVEPWLPQWLVAAEGDDEAVRNWDYPWLTGYGLHDLLFLAEEYEEAFSWYDLRARSLARYLEVKGNPESAWLAGAYAGVFLMARRTDEALDWLQRARQQTELEGKGGEHLDYAYKFALLDRAEEAMRCFEVYLEWEERDAARSPSLGYVRPFHEVRRAELLFLLRDFERCRRSLEIGSATLHDVMERRFGHFRIWWAAYQRVVEGITAALEGREDERDAPAHAGRAVESFEGELSSFLRYDIWDCVCIRLRYDTLVTRAIAGASAQDDAYREYVRVFGHDLSVVR